MEMVKIKRLLSPKKRLTFDNLKTREEYHKLQHIFLNAYFEGYLEKNEFINLMKELKIKGRELRLAK